MINVTISMRKASNILSGITQNLYYENCFFWIKGFGGIYNQILEINPFNGNDFEVVVETANGIKTKILGDHELVYVELMEMADETYL